MLMTKVFNRHRRFIFSNTDDHHDDDDENDMTDSNAGIANLPLPPSCFCKALRTVRLLRTGAVEMIVIINSIK